MALGVDRWLLDFFVRSAAAIRNARSAWRTSSVGIFAAADTRSTGARASVRAAVRRANRSTAIHSPTASELWATAANRRAPAG